MAKKFVRGITDIKNIEHQDLDTNNVNDLLSDGKHNYIHRKKQDGSEEYHNLTNNIKTIEAEDNGLLTVINYNNSTNKAKLTVHHDPQKEQKIYSTDDTIEIVHGDNGTGELTNVDVNAEKVMLNDNLLTNYGISKSTSGNNTTLGIEYTTVPDDFDLNTLQNGRVRSGKFLNSPQPNTWFLISAFSEGGFTVQEAIKLVDNQNTVFKRTKQGGSANWGAWREQVGDKSEIDTQLAQKQNTLTSNQSVGVLNNNTLKQLFYYKKTYTDGSSYLKTYVKSLSQSTNINTNQDEYNFSIRVAQGVSQVQFTLNETDTSYFSNVVGVNTTTNVCGCLCTLNESTLTVTTSNNTEGNYLISLSTIID